MKISPLKRIIAILLFLTMILNPVMSLVGTVAGTIAVIGSIKMMLSDLIQEASDEVKAILQQAFTEVEALESSLMADVADLSDAALADIDELLGSNLERIDTILQATLAQLSQYTDKLDTIVATQIQNAVHEANVTWNTALQDLDRLSVKIGNGVAVIVDNVFIQILRIIVIVGAFIVLIIGVITLSKKRTPGFIISGIAAVLLIFSFTPLFAMATASFGVASEELTLDPELLYPRFLRVRPGINLSFKQDGTIEILGMNLLSKDGPSKLLFGTNSNQLKESPQATISDVKVNVPMEIITQNSGRYYMKLQRADGQESETLSFYIPRPEEIPIRIDYTIWQSGQFRQEFTGLFQIRDSQSIHKIHKSTRRSYSRIYTPDNRFGFLNWRSVSYTRTNVIESHMSDLKVNLEGSGLRVDFKLRSGSIWDNYDGKYHADYQIVNQRTDNGTTREQAVHGSKILYFDQETSSISATKNSFYNDTFMVDLTPNILGGQVYKIGSTATLGTIKPISQKLESIKLQNFQIDLQKSLQTLPRIQSDVQFKNFSGTNSILKALPKPVERSVESSSTESSTELILAPILLEAFFFIPQTESYVDFTLGAAPDLPGFTPSKTYYDVIVQMPDQVQKILKNKSASSEVMNDEGKVLFQFYIENEELHVKWLHIE
jgi:hypothetical protein